MDYEQKYQKYKGKYLYLKQLYGGSNEQFQLDMHNTDNIIGIYALVAPDDCASTNMKLIHFERIQKIVKDINPGGLIIYDVQDEKCRDGTDRPFKFNKKEQSDIFASFITKKNPSMGVITYRVLPNQNITTESLEKWINDTIDKRKLTNIVYVGGSKGIVGDTGLNPYNYTLNYIKKFKNIIIGGITLPERYKKVGWDESDVLLKKTHEGCVFFVSQIVYNIEYIKRLMNEYADKCNLNNIKPSRIIFTFALFGEKKTISFMKCLGVDIPEEIEKSINDKPESEYIDYSMKLSSDNWVNLVKLRNDIEHDKKIKIPIGFSVDVISGNKDEFEKSFDLYNILKLIQI